MLYIWALLEVRNRGSTFLRVAAPVQSDCTSATTQPLCFMQLSIHLSQQHAVSVSPACPQHLDSLERTPPPCWVQHCLPQETRSTQPHIAPPTQPHKHHLNASKTLTAVYTNMAWETFSNPVRHWKLAQQGEGVNRKQGASAGTKAEVVLADILYRSVFPKAWNYGKSYPELLLLN